MLTRVLFYISWVGRWSNALACRPEGASGCNHQCNQTRIRLLSDAVPCRFKFEYAGTEPEDMAYKIVSHPKFGVPVTVQLRTQ